MCDRPAEASRDCMMDTRHSRPSVRMCCSSCCAFLFVLDMKSTRLLLLASAGFFGEKKHEQWKHN